MKATCLGSLTIVKSDLGVTEVLLQNTAQEPEATAEQETVS